MAKKKAKQRIVAPAAANVAPQPTTQAPAPHPNATAARDKFLAISNQLKVPKDEELK